MIFSSEKYNYLVFVFLFPRKIFQKKNAWTNKINFLFENTSPQFALREENLITIEAVSSDDKNKKISSNKVLIE